MSDEEAELESSGDPSQASDEDDEERLDDQEFDEEQSAQSSDAQARWRALGFVKHARWWAEQCTQLLWPAIPSGHGEKVRQLLSAGIVLTHVGPYLLKDARADPEVNDANASGTEPIHRLGISEMEIDEEQRSTVEQVHLQGDSHMGDGAIQQAVKDNTLEHAANLVHHREHRMGAASHVEKQKVDNEISYAMYILETIGIVATLPRLLRIRLNTSLIPSKSCLAMFVATTIGIVATLRWCIIYKHFPRERARVLGNRQGGR